MIGKYSVGFLVPSNSRKELTDDGWEFESDSRIDNEVELLLRSQLKLVESEDDYATYKGEELKVDIFKDSEGIENIYFRFYSGNKVELPDYLRSSECINGTEFFIPRKLAE